MRHNKYRIKGETKNVTWRNFKEYSYLKSITSFLWICFSLGAKPFVERSKIMTVNLITTNIKIVYAEICKELKKKDVGEGERKDIMMQIMQK